MHFMSAGIWKKGPPFNTFCFSSNLFMNALSRFWWICCFTALLMVAWCGGPCKKMKPLFLKTVSIVFRWQPAPDPVNSGPCILHPFILGLSDLKTTFAFQHCCFLRPPAETNQNDIFDIHLGCTMAQKLTKDNIYNYYNISNWGFSYIMVY